MATFNQNMAFVRAKMGFKSVQKWADYFGESMGKMREYERDSFPKEDFLVKFVEKTGIDLNMMVSTEVNDSNYGELFTPSKDNTLQEPEASYGNKSRFMELVQGVPDPVKRAELIKIYLTEVSEKDQLKDELLNAYRLAAQL